MNSLSLFLYVADVLPSLSRLLILVPSIMMISLAVAALIMAINRSDFPGRYTDVQMEKSKKTGRQIFTKFIPLLFIPIFFGILIPSQQTIYLIAGSELGEMVIETEEAQEIYDDIRQVIRSYANVEQ